MCFSIDVRFIWIISTLLIYTFSAFLMVMESNETKFKIMKKELRATKIFFNLKK